MEQNPYSYEYATQRPVTPAAYASLMRNVYLWMALALTMTGVSAFYVASSESILEMIFASPAVFYGLVIGEVALVWFLSARIEKLSFATAGILFAVYSILNGVTLSGILLVYTAESITSTFFISAGMFAAMALVGTFIKRDLSMMGRILYMVLIGLVIATIVNIFLGSSMISLVCSYIGVVLFTGLTAYDAQHIKQMLLKHGDVEDDTTMKIALMGSLDLYLDFINLFIYLLRIFGDRR